ncbi:hypothetical protein V7114_18315 [Neobacillus niacini]|uniref:hypothetical protein n=1 Tax=Neobacillus niacini TaxID=86668 RepID=UPI002FFF5C93
MKILAVNRIGNKLYVDDNGVKYAECRTCKEVGRGYLKPIADFVEAKQNILGVLYDCNECRKGEKKRWRKENPEKTRAYNRSQERIKKNREHRKKWEEKNKEKVKKMKITRLNRETAASDTIPIKEKTKTLKQYSYSCALTGTENNLQADHIIPLVTGHASNFFENILILKRDLNVSKNGRNIFDWAVQEHEHLGFTLTRFNEVMTEVALRSGMTLEEYKEYVNWCFDNQIDISG